MQRAVLNWSAMRVAEATAEAVFGCASSHGSLWPTRTATSAFNTIKPQILKRPKKDANMGINRTSGKRVSASQRDAVTAQNNQATICKPWKSLAAVAFGLLLSVPGLAQVKYSFSTIDVPGAKATEHNGNSTDAIVGQFFDAQEITRGFVLNKGSFTTIDVPLALAPGVVPGVVGTSINGINASGQVVGTYVVKFNMSGGFTTTHAFFKDNKENSNFLPLDPFNIRSQGGFINTQGQVVGTYRDNTNNHKRHGFIWDNVNGFTTLDINAPGDDPKLGTVAFGINDFGEVVGNYVAAGDVNPDGSAKHRHGFLRSSDGKSFTTFDVTGASITIGEGINNGHTIVGVYVLAADGTMHGFVLKDGGFSTVDVPDLNGNAQQTEINSINANGEIVGFYVDSKEKGTHHGFLGVPVP
jgi:hypothetical protein